MKTIFVVNHLRDWPLQVPGVEVVPARNYLMDATYGDCSDAKVFNLCKSYRYQKRGYYVSLLAEARGHMPLPDVKAIEDMHSINLLMLLTDDLHGLVQSSLVDVAIDTFTLTCYFGRSADRGHELLSEQLFNLLRMPLLRARFERRHGIWVLHRVCAICAADIAPRELPVLAQAAADCVQAHRTRTREPAAKKPTLAILHSADGAAAPSNSRALQKFQEAAESLGMRTEVVGKNDSARLAQFDALFIRDNTSIDHYTYQMARQAAVTGMVVIDDPDSILKCNNKVYLAELLPRHRIPTPKTMKVHRDNVEQVIATLGLPCILKQPDSAFSLGVVKADSEQDFYAKSDALLEKSELILAQEFMPTEFDWRVGILDRRPLFICKYFMAPGHWQIIQYGGDDAYREGMAEALALDDAPNQVIDIALQTANLIGDGFYGVDLKQRGQHCYVIEINDNPNVDAGNEDGVLGDALYREVMSVFRKRIENRKRSIAA